LHLSDKEKENILSLFKMIGDELNKKSDEFSQDIIISQLELLLNLANRFYKRQFITHKQSNTIILQKMDETLDEYFNTGKSLELGIPSVQYLSENLNISSSYLSDILRTLTGQNTRQHIHSKLIEKAKILLSTTALSVSEIAYQLGFEHPQSFSKLFKSKIKQSPVEFRKSFR